MLSFQPELAVLPVPEPELQLHEKTFPVRMRAVRSLVAESLGSSQAEPLVQPQQPVVSAEVGRLGSQAELFVVQSLLLVAASLRSAFPRPVEAALSPQALGAEHWM